jgi:hypothetical protein
VNAAEILVAEVERNGNFQLQNVREKLVVGREAG